MDITYLRVRYGPTDATIVLEYGNNEDMQEVSTIPIADVLTNTVSIIESEG